MIVSLEAFEKFKILLEDFDDKQKLNIFNAITREYKILFCEEFGLLPEWLKSYKINKSDKKKLVFDLHDVVDGTYKYVSEFNGQQLESYYYFDVIQDIIVENGLLDSNSAIVKTFKLANDILDRSQGEQLMKISEKEQNKILNSDFYHFDKHAEKEKVVLAGTLEKKLNEDVERTPAEDEQVYRTSFDVGRLADYKKPMQKATVGDVASAFGSAYHEVTNKLRIDDENQHMAESFGVKRQYLSDISETFGVFYIPLALMAVKAVVAEKLVVEATLNWKWGDPKPVGYSMFDIALDKKIRLMHTGTFLCHLKDDVSKKVWVQTKLESTMNGPIVKLKIVTNADEIDIATQLKKDIDNWMKENNYLKNKKIDGNGKFLDVAKFSWDDIVIDADIKDQIFDDVVGFLNYKDLYEKNGLPFKRGLILYGKPGCGKTLLGKVIANEIDTTFIWLTSAQVSNPKVIRSVFALARELSPCVLFFEDIDMYTVGRHVGSFSPLVGELLAQMDGMEENNGIITIATTNRLDVIEGALATRPSRFDRRFNLDNMTPETRRKMVMVKLGIAKLIGITVDEIASMLDGLNGSFIQEVIISAKRRAISNGLTNSDGVVLLDRATILQAVAEVSNSFKIMMDKMAQGDYKEYIETTHNDKDNYENLYSADELVTLSKGDIVKPLVAKKIIVSKPKNVNLTEAEKAEIDGEVEKALLMIAEANTDKTKKAALNIYLKNDGYESLAKALFGQPINKVDWRKQTKSNLRTMFRMLLLARNVRRAQGQDKSDPMQKLKSIGDLLNAMDLRSDRYYWVHAFVRIEREFGRKVDLPFNPYADQTSKDAAKKLLDILMGKTKQRKDKDDEINKQNGVFVPKKKEVKNPPLHFNEPKIPGNVVQPPVHMK